MSVTSREDLEPIVSGTIARIREALLEKRITPLELVDAVLDRIEREEPRLRAWVHVDADGARKAAKSVDVRSGPLAGVPFAVKDVIDVRGMATRYGADFTSATPVAFDAWCVAAVRAAGAIPIGKVTTTPFAFKGPPAPTINPWSSRHTPGGSSAGSGASVGARQVPFAFGTQTGGSTLRPAAYNGVVGLIASIGTIATAGMSALGPTFDRIGIICRDAADATTLLGFYDFAVTQTPERLPLKVGYARSFQHELVHPDVERVIDAALAKAGIACSVTETTLPASVTDGVPFWETFLSFEASANVREALRGKPIAAILDDALTRGASLDYARYQEAQLHRLHAQRDMEASFQAFDVIATAAADRPPDTSATGYAQLALTWPATALGLPAISLPVGLTPDGLPVGLQLVGRFGRDGDLLAAARSLEKLIGFDNPGPRSFFT